MTENRPERPAKEILDAVFPAGVEGVYRYVDLLIGQGIARGLLGPREANHIWSRHILNCAVVAVALPLGATVCDLGSGAGLPGIVLALARPDVRMTLLEPLLRRAVFLTEVLEELDLPQVVVVRARAEDARGSVRADVVTARAVAPLDRLAGWAWPLLSPGGQLLAIKGESAAAEIAAARTDLARLGVAHVHLETYGAGLVDPVTTVVRIESRG